MTPISPAFQFYPNDFYVAMASLEAVDVGRVALLYCLEWEGQGFVYEPRALARWCRCTPSAMVTTWGRVQHLFIERDGRWIAPHLETERARIRAWRDKSAKGGKRSAFAKQRARVVEPPFSNGDKGGASLLASASAGAPARARETNQTPTNTELESLNRFRLARGDEPLTAVPNG